MRDELNKSDYPLADDVNIHRTEKDMIAHRAWARRKALDFLITSRLGKDLMKRLWRKGVPPGSVEDHKEFKIFL